MNPPTFITRFLGTPLVALVLYVGCAVAVLGWTRGEVPWWLALAAVCFVGTVRKAVRDVRRYKQWSAAWQAMGSASGGAAPMPIVRRRNPSWVNVTIAVLSLLIIPIFIAAPEADESLRNGLTLLWLAIAAYLLWKLAVSIRGALLRKGAGTNRAGVAKTSASADVVKWVLPPASSSPSRLDATRNVPEYCARLMASH
jgi:hypothetical protein